MSRFYRDDYGVWSRRLLTLDGVTGKRFLDISLTPSNSVDGWASIREEKIRVHRNTDKGKLFFDELPQEVVDEMTDRLGPSLTARLLNRNFVDALGLENIIATDRIASGMPVAEVARPALWGQPL